jgi:hypothetical protein
MQRKIDIGEDKNLFIQAASGHKTVMSYLMDEMPKTGEEAVVEARKATWGNWVNSEPLVIAHTDDTGMAYLFYISEQLKSKAISLFLWDYTLLPCRRTLKYVNEWHKRYGQAGLLTIGVHTPMFEFGKEKKNVLDAIKHMEIGFPVVMDNDYNIWRSLENRFWPRLVLLDSAGHTQKDIIGEGGYQEFELKLQKILRELSPGLACPPVVKPLWPVDEPGYFVPETTPEIFLGTKRKVQIGNAMGADIPTDVEHVYVDDPETKYLAGMPYLHGSWILGQESMHGLQLTTEARITIRFKGTDAYVIARGRPRNPADIPQPQKIHVLLDKKPIAEDFLGDDGSLNEYRRAVLPIRDPKLYHVATQLDHAEHELTLIAEASAQETLEVYGFCFEHRPRVD